ncbi:hypothetical protein C8Q78DRAFT_964289 [Trametes maxima]|nr:hypothetical protein C8Q78DRAFT_964289 [Trametes maxima]
MTVAPLVSPSARLPPIRRIHEHSIESLENLVDYLRTIYNPPLRGIRRINQPSKAKATTPSHRRGDEDLALLRADEFERAYAIRWLTGLIAQASLIQAAPMDDEEGYGHEDKADVLIHKAASLLAVCAGAAAAGTLTRRFSFGSPLLDLPVEVQLTDIPISVESDAATVGAHTWGSAFLLSEMLMETPARFGLSEDASLSGPRILELGAGTGLVSLTVAKFFSARLTSTRAGLAKPTVIATDYHPAVLDNLAQNIKANFPEGDAHVLLSSHALDWSTVTNAPPPAPPFDKPFDIVIGADIVYEPIHASWIRDCVSALLRRPDPVEGHSTPVFHLLIPLRPTHVSESRAIDEVFPRARGTVIGIEPGTAPKLCTLDVDTIICEAGDAKPGVEVEYVHYTIGWA